MSGDLELGKHGLSVGGQWKSVANWYEVVQVVHFSECGYRACFAEEMQQDEVICWCCVMLAVLMKLAILFSDMPMHMCCNNHMSHNLQYQYAHMLLPFL